MIQHLTQKQVEDYCQQQLGVEELLWVSDHLGECEACRRRIENATDGDVAFFALRSEVFGEAGEVSSRGHLSAEQAAGYVDRKLSGEDVQFVADHLTNCEPCALAVDDLRAFRDQVAPSLEREYNPATVRSQREGYWHRRVASVAALLGGTPRLAFGAVVTVFLLAVTGWLIWRTAQERAPRQEIADSAAPATEPAPASQPAAVPVPVVAELKDGEGQLTLDQEGKLSGADELPAAYQGMVREALSSGRIERSSQLTGLRRPPSTLMSREKQRREFSVIEPVGKVVMSDSPTFRWTPMEGASVYVVEVYDSKFNLVAASPELTAHSWAVPALARGKVYSWQVKAKKEGQEVTAPRPPAAQAKFRIVDQAKAKELEKARRAYPRSHLVLGLLYAGAGLVKEAEEELRLLEKANPDSEIARSLLRQVQALPR